MIDQRRLAAVELRLDGRDLGGELYDALRMVRVEESVQLPDRFEVRLSDPTFEIFDSRTFAMGGEVEIGFRAETEMTVITSGEITAIAVESGGGGHELVLTGLDVTHRLHRGPRSRTFVEMTDADIASQIAREHGLDEDIDSTREVRPYVLQSSQSDFVFLSERARQIGFDVWITGRTLHFKPRPRAGSTPPSLEYGENLRSFKVRFSSTERCDEVIVRGWDPVAKEAITGRASDGDSGCSAAAADEIERESKRAFGNVTRSAGQFPVETQAAADALAESLLLRSSGGSVVARGEAVGDPRLAAGADVDISGVGSRLSGTYRISSVEHTFGAGGPYRTRFVCGGKEPAALTDLLGGGGAGMAAHRGWGSLVLGQISNVADPDNLGRVKAKFVDLDESESTWAWVAAPGAGPERGFQWLPEVGDMVIIGFEHDDKQRPVVLGGLWNRNDPPPDAGAIVDGKVIHRVQKTRNGHVIEFVDDDPGKITMALGDADCSLVLAEDESRWKGVRKIIVEGEELQVSGTSKIVLKAPTVEIAGDASLKLSGGNVEVAGSAQTKLSGATTDISGTAMVNITGAIVKLN
ncbi:MAG: VgrG-related protein [bacterium]|nr:VgrG-related protein [bacterium]